jgi:hypothetical protein
MDPYEDCHDVQFVLNRTFLNSLAMYLAFDRSQYHHPKEFCFTITRHDHHLAIDQTLRRIPNPEGYGYPFMRLMPKPGNAYRHLLVYKTTLGSISMLVRHDVDYLSTQGKPVDLISRRNKANKMGGYYPAYNRDDYRSLWCRLAFRPDTVFLVGAIEEILPQERGMVTELFAINHDTAKSRGFAADRYGKHPSSPQAILTGIADILSWIRDSLAEDEGDSGKEYQLVYAGDHNLTIYRL